MDAPDFATAMWMHRTSAIIRANDREIARRAMDAAVAAGIRIVEFTLTTPGATDLIESFAAREVAPVDGMRRLIVGAGTVLTTEQARTAVAAGARFLVSPVFDPAIVRLARDLGVGVMPGVHTPTELLAAHRAGATLLKLFPAPAGGPAWLRSVLAPMPFLRIVPTNGVDDLNLGDWLDAGAWGVGLVGPLFQAADLQGGHYDAIEARAIQMRHIAERVRRGPLPSIVDPFA